MKFYKLFDKKYLKPIIRYKNELKDWNMIPIEECKEKLISLKNVSDKIIVEPQYYIDLLPGTENDCRVRETVAKKLINIAEKLPDGYKILVWDAYRTIETQQALFDYYKNKFSKEKQLNEEQLMKYTKKFISYPSFDKENPSPHNTGAALDLTICNNNLEPIKLGTYFDDFQKRSYTRFYEEKLLRGEILTDEEIEILYNRRVLCNIFSEEGFANYPFEIWHKSIDDQMCCELLGYDTANYTGLECK